MQVGKLTRSDFVEEIEIFFPENKDVLIRLLFSYNYFICFLVDVASAIFFLLVLRYSRSSKTPDFIGRLPLSYFS